MFIAAILLVGTVVNLYLVRNNNVRLGLIGGCTAAFALTLGVLAIESGWSFMDRLLPQCNPQIEKTLAYSVIGVQRFLLYL
jgi:hypothetical protein